MQKSIQITKLSPFFSIKVCIMFFFLDYTVYIHSVTYILLFFLILNKPFSKSSVLILNTCKAQSSRTSASLFSILSQEYLLFSVTSQLSKWNMKLRKSHNFLCIWINVNVIETRTSWKARHGTHLKTSVKTVIRNYKSIFKKKNYSDVIYLLNILFLVKKQNLQKTSSCATFYCFNK